MKSLVLILTLLVGALSYINLQYKIRIANLEVQIIYLQDSNEALEMGIEESNKIFNKYAEFSAKTTESYLKVLKALNVPYERTF